MLYRCLKALITKGSYDREDMLKKLDIFFAMGRITEEQYQELVGLIG